MKTMKPIKIYLAGDSTMQSYKPVQAPQEGWGQLIQEFFTQDVVFINHAIGGRSSRSFVEEGRLNAILNVIDPENYLFVQMGHNDSTIARPLRYTKPYGNYKDYLRMYVNGARAHNAIPILITPVGRLHYENGEFLNDFQDYCKAMKQVAQEDNVLLIDLMSKSLSLYQLLGYEDAKSLFMVSHNSTDYTHFTQKGAKIIAGLIAQSVKEFQIDISKFVI